MWECYIYSWDFQVVEGILDEFYVLRSKWLVLFRSAFLEVSPEVENLPHLSSQLYMLVSMLKITVISQTSLKYLHVRETLLLQLRSGLITQWDREQAEIRPPTWPPSAQLPKSTTKQPFCLTCYREVFDRQRITSLHHVVRTDATHIATFCTWIQSKQGDKRQQISVAGAKWNWNMDLNLLDVVRTVKFLSHCVIKSDLSCTSITWADTIFQCLRCGDQNYVRKIWFSTHWSRKFSRTRVSP